MKSVLISALLFGTVAAHAAVTRVKWGEVHGQEVDRFTISNSDVTVSLTNYGARVVSIMAPDRSGVKANIALGYSDLAGYTSDTSTFMGSTVGRYGNRIAGGRFLLDGKSYQVPPNNGPNALHGGAGGFFQKVWRAEVIPQGVEFTLVSADGDMGFPGTLTAHVRYKLLEKSLGIDYTVTSNRDTVVTLTNHTYFNLAGEASGTVLNQRLTLHADEYTPVDKLLIPTGQIVPVAGTPLDFRMSRAIGERIHESNEQLANTGGYDHNFVLRRTTLGKEVAAEVIDPASGRTLTVTTTEPGLQFYSGNFLDGTLKGAGGVRYVKYAGFCLETQHFPDSPNHPNFPSTVLKKGQVLHSSTVFTFGVER